MLVTVNIPESAVVSLDTNNIIISLHVQIMDGITTIGDKVITITVYKYTDNLLNYAVMLMVSNINDFKTQCITQIQIQTKVIDFTNQVKVLV